MSRRKHSSGFKATVALEALRGELTVAQIAQKGGEKPADTEAQVGVLERKVGQLLIENDFLKKSWAGYVKRSGGK